MNLINTRIYRDCGVRETMTTALSQTRCLLVAFEKLGSFVAASVNSLHALTVCYIGRVQSFRSQVVCHHYYYQAWQMKSQLSSTLDSIYVLFVYMMLRTYTCLTSPSETVGPPLRYAILNGLHEDIENKFE